MRVIPSEGRDRHARFRQPARPAPAVLRREEAARLHGLGQVAPARHRARPRDRRQGRRARQVLRQLHGRRRVRHDRARFRDGGARRHPDHDDRPQQLDDGDRDARDEAQPREAQNARPRRQLRGIWHAISAAGASASTTPARSATRSCGRARRTRTGAPACSNSSPARRRRFRIAAGRSNRPDSKR